ncbi:MAG: hypothetical protein KC547_08895 [Anaerolineae bacterium]|nr:hypothetical protein [Anaerolineae bacterium]MCA9907783.1 hypothetical protein [Anaerolineae bacterium]
MRYPIPQRLRLPLFLIALVLTIVISLYMNSRPLRPYTIVGFEFAGDWSRAEIIVNAWRDASTVGVDYLANAGFSLSVDNAWIPCYATAISLACALATGALKGRRWWIILGFALAWAAWAAGIFDWIENAMLSQVLTTLTTDTAASIEAAPAIAAICAAIKFGLVGLGLLYALVGLVIWLGGRLART